MVSKVNMVYKVSIEAAFANLVQRPRLMNSRKNNEVSSPVRVNPV